MFFYLSKILTILLNPILWVLGIAVIGLWKKDRRIVFLALLLLYLLFIPSLSHWAMGKWESSHQSLQAEYYDIAIVLGGMIVPQPFSSEIPLNFINTSERLMEAVRLYHEGRVGKILLSGGSGSILYPDFIESQVLKEYAQSLGVMGEAIITETRSRNTHQNALYTSMILTKDYPGATVLLITSAYHIERAGLSFNKQGVYPDLYPVDFRSWANINPNSTKPKNTEEENNWIKVLETFKPKPNSLVLWGILIREVVGTLVYTIQDYI